ncbi:MAG TPA: Re/Si-specific NAD(P)(+) transhydrogenase subunit alpha [Verrucomicrobiae bacterium]|nr:Re/Si-specific NAD(P)(+) transhydrogenase subunit alpha [Verrucomicrobiae bacterium]
MKIGIPKEIVSNERRVALVPESLAALGKLGLEVLVEDGAGAGAFFSNSDYEKAKAKIVSANVLFSDSDIVVKIHRPQENPRLGKHEADALREGAVLIAFLYAAVNPDLVKRLAARKVTAFSMDAVPRISRAQSMDALSSQANVAGYKAVLIAAASLGKYLPMMTTAAGTIRPAKVLVLGAGVAGLQAIATARRLGAVVWGYDVRPVVKEQVESLGAKFLEFDLGIKDAQDKGGYAKELSDDAKRKQQQMLADKTKEFDVVITTALIPGRPAPRLITKETVAAMKPGSVIVDLAAETGGNCELTEADKEVVKHGVTLIGPTNLPSTLPVHASQLYGRNVVELLKLLVKDGKLNLDFSDEIIKGACVTHNGTKPA